MFLKDFKFQRTKDEIKGRDLSRPLFWNSMKTKKITQGGAYATENNYNAYRDTFGDTSNPYFGFW